MRLGFLSPLFDRPGPWASVYLGAPAAPDPGHSRHRARVDDVCARLLRQGADPATCRAVHHALADGVAVAATAAGETVPGADGNAEGSADGSPDADAEGSAPAPTGLALFAAHGEVVLVRALAAPPPGDDPDAPARAHWEALPRTGPLLELLAHHPRGVRARQHAATLMDRFLAGRLPTDNGHVWSADNVHSLVDAAREGRIDALLIRPGGADVHREVWVGESPDQLAIDPGDAEHLGGPHPFSARASDALLRAAAATGADTVCVHPGEVAPGTPAGLPPGGLGALLRWPYGGTPATTGARGAAGWAGEDRGDGLRAPAGRP
ncbi:hypothetical protein [Streptomyces sp. Z26]|uniref:hypothetical protein n=1 Tax=Streptomyces sp. Z26 TaxID=2500177 RepID=UPI0019D08A49|nr:hypothetical protein [Streptomyces sp. Z26]